MITPPQQAFLTRTERFASVGSTNDVVRAWLADGTPEVCLAVADEQTAGRGREGRPWLAPTGAALLVSLGFRPTWLAPTSAWRAPAIVALAMAEAAEDVARLAPGTVWLKWPNDLIVLDDADGVRKLAGVLAETDGLGTDDPRVVVGIGVNVDWPAAEFPSGLHGTMTSLREAAGGRAVDRDAVLDAFIDRLEERTDDLRRGAFDEVGWVGRQATTDRLVRLQTTDGVTETTALGVDPATGALLVEDPAIQGAARAIHAGEIVHVRLADPSAGV